MKKRILQMPPARRKTWYDVLNARQCAVCEQPKKPYWPFCPYHIQQLRQRRYRLYWHVLTSKHAWCVAYWRVGARFIRAEEMRDNLKQIVKIS